MLIFPIQIIIRVKPFELTFHLFRIDIYAVEPIFLGCLLGLEWAPKHYLHGDILFLSGIYCWLRWKKRRRNNA